MKTLVVILALLPGCSLAVLGSAESTCTRWYAAMAQHETKCHEHWVNDAPDCTDVDMTFGGSIDDCESDMSALQCGNYNFPNSCRISWRNVPVL